MKVAMGVSLIILLSIIYYGTAKSYVNSFAPTDEADDLNFKITSINEGSFSGVWEAGNQIVYAKSVHSGFIWNDQRIIGNCSNPSIDSSSSTATPDGMVIVGFGVEYIAIACESNGEIFFTKSDNGNSWTNLASIGMGKNPVVKWNEIDHSWNVVYSNENSIISALPANDGSSDWVTNEVANINTYPDLNFDAKFDFACASSACYVVAASTAPNIKIYHYQSENGSWVENNVLVTEGIPSEVTLLKGLYISWVSTDSNNLQNIHYTSYNDGFSSISKVIRSSQASVSSHSLLINTRGLTISSWTTLTSNGPQVVYSYLDSKWSEPVPAFFASNLGSSKGSVLISTTYFCTILFSANPGFYGSDFDLYHTQLNTLSPYKKLLTWNGEKLIIPGSISITNSEIYANDFRLHVEGSLTITDTMVNITNSNMLIDQNFSFNGTYLTLMQTKITSNSFNLASIELIMTHDSFFNVTNAFQIEDNSSLVVLLTQDQIFSGLPSLNVSLITFGSWTGTFKNISYTETFYKSWPPSTALARLGYDSVSSSHDIVVERDTSPQTYCARSENDRSVFTIFLAVNCIENPIPIPTPTPIIQIPIEAYNLTHGGITILKQNVTSINTPNSEEFENSTQPDAFNAPIDESLSIPQYTPGLLSAVGIAAIVCSVAAVIACIVGAIFAKRRQLHFEEKLMELGSMKK